MQLKKVSDKPEKAGYYFTDVGRCYFQGGIWKGPRHHWPKVWLDEHTEPWIEVTPETLPEPDFPLFVFIAHGIGVITGGLYHPDTGFSLMVPHVEIKSPVTHYMYQFAPPPSWVKEMQAKALKEVLDQAEAEEKQETSSVQVIDEFHKSLDIEQIQAIINAKAPAADSITISNTPTT